MRGVLPAVLLALVACGGGRDDPKAFRERADLASCGSIGAHRPGDPFTPAEHAKIACLTGAHEAGTGMPHGTDCAASTTL